MSRGPLTLSREYRQHALECVQLARKADDNTERATFFDLARAWLRASSESDDTLPRYSGRQTPPRKDGTHLGDTVRHGLEERLRQKMTG
jgi:hypothetical protein